VQWRTQYHTEPMMLQIIAWPQSIVSWDLILLDNRPSKAKHLINKNCMNKNFIVLSLDEKSLFMVYSLIVMKYPPV
jgi:hypothetical protein